MTTKDKLRDVVRVYRAYGEGPARAKLVEHGWSVDNPARLEALLGAVRELGDRTAARTDTMIPPPQPWPPPALAVPAGVSERDAVHAESVRIIAAAGCYDAACEYAADCIKDAPYRAQIMDEIEQHAAQEIAQ